MKKFLAITLALALCLSACATCFAASDEGYVLEEGVNKPIVKVLQYLLATCGYYDDEIDGDFGPVTKAAVEAMQKDLGLEVTGTVDISSLAGEFDPEAWIDWVVAGRYDFDDEVEEILETLLTADLFDDESPYDFIADLAFIYELVEDEVPNKDQITTVLAALIAYAYDADEEENDDTAALLELADLLSNKDDEYAELLKEYHDTINLLVEAAESPEDLEAYQNLLMTELLDNSDLTDVSVILHIPGFLSDPSNASEDFALAYALLAIIDYFDDSSTEDALKVVDLVKGFDFEDEDGYQDFFDSAADLFALLSNKNAENYHELYLDLLLYDLLDDNKIEDFEIDLFLIQLLAQGEYDLADDVLLSAGISDFVDDSDYTDVGIVYEIAKLASEEFNQPEFLDTIDRLIENAL